MTSSTVGPWARKKLKRLRDYLSAYAVIMAKQQRDGWLKGFHYIDAFAGPGSHVERPRAAPNVLQQLFAEVARYSAQYPEQRAFLAGSPRVALDIQPEFSACYFVEKSDDRVASLQELKKEFPKRRIEIRQMDCNEFLRQVVNTKPSFWRRNRAVAFLDPFGMQVPWNTIELLGQTQAIDILVNFPVGMAIQRLLLRSGEFTKPQRRKLDEYFGSPDWFHEIYKKDRNLWGDEETVKVEKSGEALVKWYQKRLKGAFGYVSRASLIRNTRRFPLYYLILASPKPIAAKIANHILDSDED
ncbi:MAG TPA: three-Cys-motif partner protein TcmP [Pirellulaceae bacterium]|nr:three-Cys-motif partner protein TcmP [Pirellulaceae bacterium]